MTYAELSEVQARRSRQFAEAQVNAMSVYCDAERDLKELQAENAKLRELVDLLLWGIDNDVPPAEGLVWSQKVNVLMRELGVDDGTE